MAPVMTRADFADLADGLRQFRECGHSDAAREKCVDGWSQDAASSSTRRTRHYARDAAGYYLDTRLRSSPAEQQKYCKPLKA